MSWILVLELIYLILIIFVILRVLYDTRSSTKALAYILFIIFVPIIGMLFYFSFGINYRKRKLYSKKIEVDEPLRIHINNSGLISEQYKTLTNFIHYSAGSPLTANNKVRLLINGEEKFPALIKSLENAKSHIHIEYYIYENDVTGNEIAEILIRKAQQGIEVRL